MGPLFISIIIPVYNAEKHLVTCIESILNQTSQNFELLLIDDGSTDASGKICNKYAQLNSRIKTFHIRNSGVSIARNIGIEHSKGEYISFVDADDWLSCDYVETILQNIEGWDLLFFSNDRCFEDGNIIGQYHADTNCMTLAETESFIMNLKSTYKQYEYFGFTWNKCFRANIIHKYNIKFVPNLKVREDEVFTNAYCRHIKTTRFIKKRIYNYRETSIGLTYKPKRIDEWLLLCRSMDETTNGIKDKDLLLYEKNRILSFYLHYITIFNYKEFIEIYSFYHRNFSPPLVSQCRKAIIFKCPPIISFIIYGLYTRVKSIFITLR